MLQSWRTCNFRDLTPVARWTWSYEPFGAIRTETQNGSPPANFLKFTGEYLDPTGLYHLRARQYDPQTGRFLSRDPLTPSLSDPSVSSYAYVNDQPTVFIDPSGLRWCDPACGVVDPVVGSVQGVTKTAVGVGVIVVGVVMAVGGPFVAGACLAVTKGVHAVHCVTAGGMVSTAGLGAIYVGVGLLGKSEK